MDSLKDLTSKLFSKVMNLSTETADIDPIIYRKKVDDLETHTSEEQRKTEDSCYMLIERWRSFGHDSTDAVLLRKIDHFYYVLSGLSKLPRGYVSLDASRPWIVFWTIHSMELLGTLKELPVHIVERCVKWLARCQHPTGGFGGGPQQLPHLAPTYAAVSALCILGASHDYDQAFELIDREKLYAFLRRMKSPCGGFTVTDGGEIDTRGCYTALSVASMTNIITPELTHNVGNFIRSCQTYEGGIGGEPGNEAHGGYSYCGLAALLLIGQPHAIDIAKILKWAANRQMGLEGGFQGRTNKLVDGCYSFWVGALFPLINSVYAQHSPSSSSSVNHDQKTSSPASAPSFPTPSSANPSSYFTTAPCFDGANLQKYVLVCCQAARKGGLKDKPGKYPDYYHTCYCLSGLACAQQTSTVSQPEQQSQNRNHNNDSSNNSNDTSNDDDDDDDDKCFHTQKHAHTQRPSMHILGNKDNALQPNDPLYNITLENVPKVLAYFQQQANPPLGQK